MSHAPAQRLLAMTRLLLAAAAGCGPIAAEPGLPTGSTSQAGSSGPGESGDPTTGTRDPTTGIEDPAPGDATSAGDATTTGDATNTGDTTSTGDATTGDASSGDDGTTGPAAPEFRPCESLQFCPASDATCPPAAQVNAAVGGDTPLGPFTASFAAASLQDAYGSRTELVLVPAYSEGELCAPPSRLMLVVPHPCWDAGPELTVPAELTLAGQTATTTATLHDFSCDWWSFFCDGCTGHLGFALEIAADGWSLAGAVDVGCCRSFHHEHAL